MDDIGEWGADGGAVTTNLETGGGFHVIPKLAGQADVCWLKA